MTGALDTQVFGDPASCRSGGQWFDQLSKGTDKLGTAVQQTRSASEGCWQGSAGEGFRGLLQTNGRNTDDVSSTAANAAKALKAFAEDLDTVRSRMSQARSVAQGAGLTVTDTAILPPEPAPSSPGAAAGSPQAAANDKAQSGHAAKAAAFKEASATVEDARGLERTAHEKLKGDMSKSTSLMEQLKNSAGWTAAGLLRTLSSSPYSTAQTFAQSAGKRAEISRVARTLANNKTMSQAGQAAARAKYFKEFNSAARDVRNALSNARIDGKVPLPAGVKSALAKAPGEGLAASDNFFKSAGGKVLSKFPYSGLALAGISTGVSIANGTPADKAVASGVGTTVAATGASAGATAGLVALGMAGGPATLAGVGVGIAVSTGVGWFVDNHWDDVKEGVGDFFGSVF